MSNRNITLSLPEEDLQRVRVLAAHRGTSISRLLADLLRDLLDTESGYAAAKAQSLEVLRVGADLGTQGSNGWTRDALHER